MQTLHALPVPANVMVAAPGKALVATWPAVLPPQTVRDRAARHPREIFDTALASWSAVASGARHRFRTRGAVRIDRIHVLPLASFASLSSPVFRPLSLGISENRHIIGMSMGDNPINLLSRQFPDPMEWAVKLRGRPLFEISGVVSPSGAGAGNTRGQQLWMFRVDLDIWKHTRGQIQTTPLMLRKPMTNEEAKALMANFKPYDVVRVHARIAEAAVNGRFDALLERFIGKPGDEPELNQAAEKLQSPVTVDSARFGRFTLDRRVNWFRAKTEWCGAPIRLTLPVEKGGNPDDSIRLAEKVWDSQSEWDRRVRHFATAELLPLKNGTWLNEDESPLTDEEFRKKMKLHSVTVDTDGTLEFWFYDGDMFGGHEILVKANFTDGPIDAGIEG